MFKLPTVVAPDSQCKYSDEELYRSREYFGFDPRDFVNSLHNSLNNQLIKVTASFIEVLISQPLPKPTGQQTFAMLTTIAEKDSSQQIPERRSKLKAFNSQHSRKQRIKVRKAIQTSIEDNLLVEAQKALDEALVIWEKEMFSSIFFVEKPLYDSILIAQQNVNQVTKGLNMDILSESLDEQELLNVEEEDENSLREIQLEKERLDAEIHKLEQDIHTFERKEKALDNRILQLSQIDEKVSGNWGIVLDRFETYCKNNDIDPSHVMWTITSLKESLDQNRLDFRDL